MLIGIVSFEVNSLAKGGNFDLMPVKGPDGKMVHYFITLVKLPSGKSAASFMKAIDEADKVLPGGTRHSRGIHEDHSFVTLGRYDLVVMWRAPDIHTMGQYVQELFNKCGSALGSTETLVATHRGAQ